MEFADYGMYADDADHHIDLRNPHFRQDSYQHMQHHHVPQQDFYGHPQFPPHYAHHLASLAVDVKPRLTKEQHDILESHYQQQSKPNTQTKKGFAEALGVSLDKVNNWFQNRRAKSKQDAKKAAGQYTTSGQQGQQTNQQTTTQSGHSSQPSSSSASQLGISTEDLSAQFLSSEYLNSPHTDSAISIDPLALSNGLGITSDSSTQQHSQTPTTMSPQDLMTTTSVQSSPANLKVEHNDDIETHRRTLTQEQFDSFANSGDYIAGKSTDSAMHESPKQLDSSSSIDDFLGEFSFGNSNNDGFESNDMHAEFNPDTFGTGSSFFTEHQGSTPDNVPRNMSTQSSISDWSEHSTPSLSITPVVNQADSGYAASETEISPRGKIGSTSSTQWQPGQSVPVDFTAIDREFQEAAARAESQSSSSGHTRRNSSVPFAEQQMTFANEQPFTQSEAPAALTQGMNNMGLSNEASSQPTSRSGSASGGIAARRQRPRPQPLAASSLRSASYCGALPTAPGLHSNNGLTPTAAPPTLRRIKSSNVMNGIANGRIQKNIGGPQRSPLNFTFAEAMNSPKFARRVSSYSPAGMPVQSASLAPPTPLSPTELSHRLEMQRQSSQMFGAHQMSRQPSINELHEESQQQMLSANQSNTFSSPPTTPNYAAHMVRSRLAGSMMNESTPPQSAPATQQCFPSNMYSSAPQMQATMSQGPMMQPQQQSFAPVMSNEYPTMHNVAMPSQQMQAGQYLQMLQAQQQMDGMSQMLQNSQPMNMGYGNMQFGHNLSAQQITPPNMQFPFVPSNSGVLLSQGHQIHHAQSKSVPAADFFVHEYSPPQDVKRVLTPRKSADTGPKNYTFANHGPEHFEKTKQKDLSQSPGSSSGQSSSGV
ncbi:homeobox domain-containing protein 2 [Elsinoe australis]|uniref:Homeobox domain-containing protein 2 n=1 Tax=Elsinoe australis TaxID=40998 RepID=A0A4V6YAV9_9PEZI|nr:homeobox domain-containing protein 2 [Elsinoe australis]